MFKTLIGVMIAAAFMGLGGTAQSAMPKIDRPTLEKTVEQIICIGNRRNYRNFNHCIRVLGPRATRYCSRICR